MLKALSPRILATLSRASDPGYCYCNFGIQARKDLSNTSTYMKDDVNDINRQI